MAKPGDRFRVVPELAQHRFGVLTLIGGGTQLVGLRIAAHMDRLADQLLRTELRVADRLGDPEMLDLRGSKGLVDRLIGPHGTPALLSRSTQKAFGCWRMISARCALSAGRFLARATTVAKS